MHRQMHHTDVVAELSRRRSISLVARSKKLKLSCLRASHAHLPSDRLINQCRADNALVIGIVPNSSNLADWSTSPQAYSAWWSMRPPRSPSWQTGRPVPEHTVLGGRCSPQISELTDWATSPRAYSARWSAQSPGTLILHQFSSVILKKASYHINE